MEKNNEINKDIFNKIKDVEIEIRILLMNSKDIFRHLVIKSSDIRSRGRFLHNESKTYSNTIKKISDEINQGNLTRDGLFGSSISVAYEKTKTILNINEKNYNNFLNDEIKNEFLKYPFLKSLKSFDDYVNIEYKKQSKIHYKETKDITENMLNITRGKSLILGTILNTYNDDSTIVHEVIENLFDVFDRTGTELLLKISKLKRKYLDTLNKSELLNIDFDSMKEEMGFDLTLNTEDYFSDMENETKKFLKLINIEKRKKNKDLQIEKIITIRNSLSFLLEQIELLEKTRYNNEKLFLDSVSIFTLYFKNDINNKKTIKKFEKMIMKTTKQIHKAKASSISRSISINERIVKYNQFLDKLQYQITEKFKLAEEIDEVLNESILNLNDKIKVMIKDIKGELK